MSLDDLLSLLEEARILFLVAFIFIFNICITTLEAIIDRMRNTNRDWHDSFANLSIFLFNQLLDKTLFGALFFLALLPFYFWLSPFEIPMTIATWLLAMLMADLTYYWMHRIEHTYRLLWSHHSVHHSSKDYNLTIAMRLCIFESLLTWIFLVPMILIGFNPFQTVVAFILVVQYQTWIHTQRINKLTWLEGIINTPSAHRVHHGSNRQYLDKNFGSVLMIWDRVFGTYAPETEPVIYGLTEQIGTNNPVRINVMAYQKLFQNVCAQTGTLAKISILFGRLNTKASRSN